MKSNYTLYHNPDCSKSRAALALLESNDINPDIIYYLEQPLTAEEIRGLMGKLGITLAEMLRPSEPEFDEYDLSDSTLSEDLIMDIVVQHPNLIQRPILVVGDRAVIGRPPENVLTLIETTNK
ncbi:MAG: arsenate reductase [Pseudohongiellaceae bacterium]|jgi:arsenate reductase